MKVTDKITITNEDNMVMMSRYPDKYLDSEIKRINNHVSQQNLFLNG